MAWFFLIVAGGLEVFWSTCLKYSEGFTVPKFTVLTVAGMVFSFLCLSQATKVLPLGTSYAIWTGIGALACRCPAVSPGKYRRARASMAARFSPSSSSTRIRPKAMTLRK